MSGKVFESMLVCFVSNLVIHSSDYDSLTSKSSSITVIQDGSIAH